MRRFAVPLAVFVLANGALVLFNQYRLSRMKGRLSSFEEERAHLRRELDRCRDDREQLSNDLCATELARLQAERELRGLRRLTDSDSWVHFRAIDAKVVATLADGSILLNQGTEIGCRGGMKFTLYRGDRLVGIAVLQDAGQSFSIASLPVKHVEPAVGDDASNHIVLSSMQSNPRDGK